MVCARLPNLLWKKRQLMPLDHNKREARSPGKTRARNERIDKLSALIAETRDVEEKRLFSDLVALWNAGILNSHRDRYKLGKLALKRRDFQLARDTFQSLLKDPPRGLRKRETQELMDDVKQCWLYADIMAQARETPAQQPVTQAQRKTSQGRKRAKPVETQTASPAVEPVAPSPAQEKPVTSPFHVEIPKVHVAFETDSAPVIEAIRQNRRADAHAFDLAL